MQRRLYRTRQDQKLGGVCGGLGQYFGIDPVWIRILFILATLGPGFGLIVYLILWVVIPYAEASGPSEETMKTGADEIAAKARSLGKSLESLGGANQKGGQLIGIGLIFLGVVFALRTLDLFWFRWFRFETLWPLILVAAGVMLILRPGIGSEPTTNTTDRSEAGGAEANGLDANRGGLSFRGRHSTVWRLRSGLVLPATLVLAGILILMQNLGLLTADLWELLWRFWPVWLIALGVEVLFGRRSVIGPLLSLLLILGVVGGAIWFDLPGSLGLGSIRGSQSLAYGLEGASRANVSLKVGVAKLRLTSMESPLQLLKGDIRIGSHEEIRPSHHVTDDTAYLELEHRMVPVGWSPGGQRTWNLQLTEQVPMRLSVTTGVGESYLDLSSLQVTNLKIGTGVGKTTVTLPSQGDLQAEISGGVGEMVIRIPRSMAARIQVQTGLGATEVGGDFHKQGEYYLSPDYAQATNRVDLQVKGGVGKIRVEQASR